MAKDIHIITDVIKPHERQKEFLEAIGKHKYVLYGGAKGGGKSYILRWSLVVLLLTWAKQGHRNVRVALFCEDYPALKDRQITKIKKEFPKWLGELKDSNTEGMSFTLRPQFGGGVIALRNLDDPSKYASSEFAAAAVDELTKNEREVFDQLRSIVRWPGIEDTKILGGTNPGDKGHYWVKKIWIDRELGPEDPKPDQVCFVRSLPVDNPHNTQSYFEELKSLPEKLRKAYYEGNWDVFEGQFFTEWDKDQHVVWMTHIQAHWKKFRSYDYGYEAPACCKWYALDNDGNVWAYKEKYWPKGHRTGVDKQAEEIARISGNETYEYSIADPSIFSAHGIIDSHGGQTIAETFARHGIMFMPGSNRRVDGWALMHQYLSWAENRKPKLRYFKWCADSVRTIPLLFHDDKKPEDLDTESEDHAADCDRYFLMSLHERKSPEQKNEVEKKLEQLRKREYMSPAHANKFYYGI